jgi:hypothetical protein
MTTSQSDSSPDGLIADQSESIAASSPSLAAPAKNDAGESVANNEAAPQPCFEDSKSSEKLDYHSAPTVAKVSSESGLETEYLQRKTSKHWRWTGVLVCFCLGWIAANTFYRDRIPVTPQSAPAVPVATSVPPAAKPVRNSQTPVAHAATPATAVERVVATEPTPPASGVNSDRLRKIFDKSMQAADALK